MNETLIKPEIGMGATILYWSDRTPCTIIRISKSGKHIVVQCDQYKIVSGSEVDGSAEYEYNRNENGSVYDFTLRKNGRWVKKGESIKGLALGIGERYRYYDPCF